jgi:hypothetical protein
MDYKPLFVSFSGGRSSAFMGEELGRLYKGKRPLYYVFANTGQEREETLEFVNECDKQLGWSVVWLEAVVHPKKSVGTTFKIVNFETACRDGSIYEAVTAKYGIANLAYIHCTREMKEQVIKKYVRSLGYKHRQYEMAVGIRADEARESEYAKKHHCVIYPMKEWGTDKQDVNDFWEKMPFNLRLKEHQGNCKWCYKKSAKKHAMIYHDDPACYEFPAMLEEKYQDIAKGGRRSIFRENRNTKQHIEFIKTIDISTYVERPDENEGCSASCEVFS